MTSRAVGPGLRAVGGEAEVWDGVRGRGRRQGGRGCAGVARPDGASGPGWRRGGGDAGGLILLWGRETFCVGVAALPALLFLLSSPTLDFLNPAKYFKGTVHGPFVFPSDQEVNIEPIMTPVFSVFEILKNIVPSLVWVWVSVFDICQLLGFSLQHLILLRGKKKLT